MASAQEPVSRYIHGADGLRLHCFDYPASPCGGAGLLPVVCLPGLARSADDFDRIARTQQADGRRVLALDYRGRGRSDWDQDWRRYDFNVEHADIMAQLAHSGRTAHRDLQDSCRSERVISLANHATTDPKLTADLYLGRNSISWFEIVVVDVLDQVLRHPFREVVLVSDAGFHAPSLP